MKLLANENFPLDSITFLSLHSFDIRSIGIDYSGITDKEVMQIAMNEQRTILTFDRDYGELIFKHLLKPEMGVIYLRLKKYDTDEPGKIIAQLFSNKDFDVRRKLTVIAEDSIRQRSY